MYVDMRGVARRTPSGRALTVHVGLGGGGVGDDLPVGRGRDRQREGRLEVGLLEAGVHRVGRPRSRTACRGTAPRRRGRRTGAGPRRCSCRRSRRDHEDVVRQEAGQGDPLPVEDRRQVQRLAVEDDPLHGRGQQIDPRRPAVAGEGHRRRAGNVGPAPVTSRTTSYACTCTSAERSVASARVMFSDAVMSESNHHGDHGNNIG